MFLMLWEYQLKHSVEALRQYGATVGSRAPLNKL